MSDKETILMRRMGVKTESIRKDSFGGFLGGKATQVLLDNSLAMEEKLCLVSNDGDKAEVVSVEDVSILCGQKQNLAAGDMLFAVFRPPFNFCMSISAGEDGDGYPWFFEMGGRLEILKPAAFARTFRGMVGKETPLTSIAFEELLGTIPATIMHDKVLVDVLGVMSLGEKDGEDHYVDMRKRLNQEKGVGEKFITSAISETFDEFFGEEKVVAMKVTSFHAHSPECEKEIARRAEVEKQNIAEEVERYKAAKKKAEADRLAQEEEDLRQKELKVEKHQTNLERERIERNRIREQEKADSEKREREKKLAAKKHEVEMAELEAQLAAQKNKLKVGSVESAFEAFESLANVFGNMVAGNGGGTFAGLLQEARRSEAGLKVVAVARDRKKRSGGVKLLKKKRTYGTRSIGTRGLLLTPTLKYGESLSSTIVCERNNGYLTVLNVSEKNEIVPMLPNEDIPDVRIASGERIVIGDENSDLIKEIHEGAQSGTDHLVAIVSDMPLLDGPLPTFGEALPPADAARFAAKLASLDDANWSADVMSFKIFP